MTEVVVHSLRVSRLNGLTPKEYSEAMMIELESTDDKRIQPFNSMLIKKNKVAQTNNKRVKRKSFKARLSKPDRPGRSNRKNPGESKKPG